MPATIAAPRSSLRQATLWGHQELAVGQVRTSWIALDKESAVLHQPDWLAGADTAFDEVLEEADWRTLRRPMYDRIVDVPRRIATLHRSKIASSAALGVIVEGAESLLGVEVDHVGLNHYRDGADSVTWHRDRIGNQRDWSVVVLVSLGGPRTLRVRPWAGSGRSGATQSFTLASGDLFIMAGACQRDWEHAVLKTAVAWPRISVALRSRQFPQGPLFQHQGVPPLTD